ncbi:MAG: hypothetical protein BAA03_14810 [Caldibacillus debilis]|nr:MAG: hypothetical protein BAA03_14810 [Caldibacillus debilis]
MNGRPKKGKDFSCAAAGPAICPKKQPKEGYDFPCRDLRTSDVVHRNRKKLARFHRKHSPLIGVMPEGIFLRAQQPYFSDGFRDGWFVTTMDLMPEAPIFRTDFVTDAALLFLAAIEKILC